MIRCCCEILSAMDFSKKSSTKIPEVSPPFKASPCFFQDHHQRFSSFRFEVTQIPLGRPGRFKFLVYFLGLEMSDMKGGYNMDISVPHVRTITIWEVPKMVVPPNHPLENRVLHYINHPFWDTTLLGTPPTFDSVGHFQKTLSGSA